MRGLNRQDVPPPPGPRYPIFRLKAGQVKVYILLSRLRGCYTHWNKNHSEPCFGEKNGCPGCKHGLPSRWKGYIHAWCQNDNDEGFLELTPLAARNVCNCVGTLTDAMRGNRIQVERGRGDRARLSVSLQAHISSLSHEFKLPEPKTPFETLGRLWNEKLDDEGPDVIPISA